MSLIQPEIKVRSIVNKDGKRRWIVRERKGIFHLAIGFPHHRTFHTWKAAMKEANNYARKHITPPPPIPMPTPPTIEEQNAIREQYGLPLINTKPRAT